MAVCVSPITAYQRRPGDQPVMTKPPDFNPSWRTLSLNCERCIPCRLADSGQKAIRMMHERRYYGDDAVFATLTYDDEHLPAGNVLVKRHHQLFMKSLRKAISPAKVRGVITGEYSPRGRPHYHAVLYGIPSAQLVLSKWARNDRGDVLSRSGLLEGVWKRGMVVTGQVTAQSCRYVVSYSLKDTSTGPSNRKDFGAVNLETGEWRPIQPPYTAWSTKPGIGKAWFEEFESDAFPSDFLVVDGSKVPVPKYYLRLLKSRKPEAAQALLAAREKAARNPRVRANLTPERRAVRAECLIARLKLHRRGSPS